MNKVDEKKADELAAFIVRWLTRFDPTNRDLHNNIAGRIMYAQKVARQDERKRCIQLIKGSTLASLSTPDKQRLARLICDMEND